MRRIGQRLEHRLHLAVQREGEAAAHRGEHRRADFDGFFDYVAAHSKYRPGVYSAVVVWNSIFGSSNAPTGFCLKSGGCAQFFGGVTRSSANALMWQWSGGGGVTNGIGGFNGDLDQIDGARPG